MERRQFRPEWCRFQGESRRFQPETRCGGLENSLAALEQCQLESEPKWLFALLGGIIGCGGARQSRAQQLSQTGPLGSAESFPPIMSCSGRDGRAPPNATAGFPSNTRSLFWLVARARPATSGMGVLPKRRHSVSADISASVQSPLNSTENSEGPPKFARALCAEAGVFDLQSSPGHRNMGQIISARSCSAPDNS
jgi:hypothetical protein